MEKELGEQMPLYSFKEHVLDLKSRMLKILLGFICFSVIAYCFKEAIIAVLLEPLASFSSPVSPKKIIYTKLTEAFFSYVKLAAFGGSLASLPVFAYQAYSFIKPGLYRSERRLAALMLIIAPFLFWSGAIFVFYFVMPKAWEFFLSFESQDALIPIVLEARISEYLDLVIQLVIAFGVAFELPIVLLILNMMNMVSVQALQQKRKIAIVVIFIIAGVLTPPDILSQFALAMPMLLLYEISVVMCKVLEKSRRNRA